LISISAMSDASSSSISFLTFLISMVFVASLLESASLGALRGC
jgi:hypothetical protein